MDEPMVDYTGIPTSNQSAPMNMKPQFAKHAKRAGAKAAMLKALENSKGKKGEK